MCGLCEARCRQFALFRSMMLHHCRAEHIQASRRSNAVVQRPAIQGRIRRIFATTRSVKVEGNRKGILRVQEMEGSCWVEFYWILKEVGRGTCRIMNLGSYIIC